MEVIEIHGLGKCLKDNIKLKCEIIVENLRPATLKEQIKHAIDCDPTLKSNLHRFFDVVTQEAIKNQQAFDLSQNSTPRPTRRKREGLPPGGCLHCKRGDHWLDDCPTAAENQKKDAMKAYLKNKKREKEL
ncbi:hypothetical protein PC113_g5407 [Phytophthora cactorum]|nr:hypothetical protein PC111_g14564 [Phytophthora cactorum]KAG2835284.1 hypothetical protein PC112_g5762 [Phytophthora cactorum]KAG2863491.1 hypothetical protein PC113_g5407 [Phytophthora cactorum]KAG3028456.1 hypothetical protein PC120_g4861 [Phytophthora cactorum]KAG3185241.1 hypothetical protein C6341_g4573 [Phytophthora cactorum]